MITVGEIPALILMIQLDPIAHFIRGIVMGFGKPSHTTKAHTCEAELLQVAWGKCHH